MTTNKSNGYTQPNRLISVSLMRRWMAVVSLALMMSLGLSACNNSSMSDTNGNNSSLGSNAGTTSAIVGSGVGNGSGTNSSSNSSNASGQPVALQATTAASNQTNSGAINPSGNLENDIQTVVEKSRPAVVLIVARGSSQEGAGTGSIITPDGYIITNHHVIEPAQGGGSITVVLDNGQKSTAQVVGDVQDNDLAVLKINGSNLPTIPLGSSSSVKVGQWAVAIGNALALPGGPTVTAGIISAIGRSIQEPNGANLSELVQTSAAINPGNSGGPLLNLRGELVGINTAAPVDPESQNAAQGIGFAIPVDQAKAISQQVINGKGVPASGNNGSNTASGRPFIGITSQTLTAGLAARYNLTASQGVLILQVSNNSPAAKAGLKPGMVIVGMDGKQINTQEDIRAILAQHKAGDTVQFVIVTQQGQQQQVNVTFASA